MLLETILSISMMAGGHTDTLRMDSLPVLHTILEKDIASVVPSTGYDTMVVTMKDGRVYTYGIENWEYEDSYPSLANVLREAVRRMRRTFIKVEHPPEFPGGQEAWDKYIADFCQAHKRELRRSGGGTVTVQFIVHIKGQITDVEAISFDGGQDLKELAKQVIKDGPPWICARQNGYKVVSYMKQVVKLGL